MYTPFPYNWLKNFSSYFCVKIAHYDCRIMCWNSLIYLITFIIREPLTSSSFSSAGTCTEITVKLLNFPLILNEHILSSTASKFTIVCLYFLLKRKPVPEVLLSLPLYQYEIPYIQHSTSPPCYLLDCCSINFVFFQFCFNLF